MADEPHWLTFEEVVETNVEQIERFGGLHGIKDENIIRSAIDNPKNSFHYGGEDDLLVLAVHLCMAIVRNHGFNDGNKRTGAVSLTAFLIVNGYDLRMPDDTLLGRMMEAVLTRDMTEEEFVEHLDHYVIEL